MLDFSHDNHRSGDCDAQWSLDAMLRAVLVQCRYFESVVYSWLLPSYPHYHES